MSQKDSSFNYVVCHTEHDAKWDGKEGVDWSHSHQEFDIQVGGTIGYEIYAAKSGVFTRIGDGGFLNWAYKGAIINTEDDGKKVTFAAPP
ncbi:hypothetical protein K435DRAFT_719190 [Dendrothele bispora CBS 962.96]|uniref:Uncharacterized protein n=1 Tax=Dendrothele bispora (strain CBS 962.96) TaxID=1314807 RepID=A0A4S8MCH2_DENBC|nr:hypothetical protein K435DRAFT_719190 [Dendrothele bispora CBS 962.96]